MAETADERPYKYTVRLNGTGGEYACIPVTPKQASYWARQGNEALTTHLSWKGQNDQDVPSEYQLPDFREQSFLCGIDPDMPAMLTVRGPEGICLELSSEDEEFRERLHFSREVGPFDGPPDQPTIMYRTFLKGADVYRLTTTEPFDPARLRFDCAEVAQCGDVISGVVYDGGVVEFVSGADEEVMDPTAILLRS